jgi:hypothetical protein
MCHEIYFQYILPFVHEQKVGLFSSSTKSNNLQFVHTAVCATLRCTTAFKPTMLDDENEILMPNGSHRSQYQARRRTTISQSLSFDADLNERFTADSLANFSIPPPQLSPPPSPPPPPPPNTTPPTSPTPIRSKLADRTKLQQLVIGYRPRKVSQFHEKDAQKIQASNASSTPPPPPPIHPLIDIPPLPKENGQFTTLQSPVSREILSAITTGVKLRHASVAKSPIANTTLQHLLQNQSGWMNSSPFLCVITIFVGLGPMAEILARRRLISIQNRQDSMSDNEYDCDF